MSRKSLSPDAQFIMDMLYKLLNNMERYEQQHPGTKRLLGKETLDHFIQHLEKELGIISLR